MHQVPIPFIAREVHQLGGSTKLLFAYRGRMNEHITEGILSISENTLEEHTSLAPMNRKVSFLLVECFQNILRHGDFEDALPADQEMSSDSMFSFRTYDETFYINSVNRIRSEDRKRLTEIVDQVNALDKQELRELYKAQLVDNELSDRGGAGLGLIELARKSGRPIHYAFDESPEGSVLFRNQVSFGIKSDATRNFDAETAKLNRFMQSDDLLLVYKGDLSQKSILPLLSMAEMNTMNGPNTSRARKVGHVLIEMLQNISRHAAPQNGLREGVMAIGRKSEGFMIQTGNLVNEEQKQALQGILNEIAACDVNELRALHRRKFKESLSRDDRYSSGLGIVQVARDGQGRVAWKFEESKDGLTFFSFAVLV